MRYLLLATWLVATSSVMAATPAELLAGYIAQSGQSVQIIRGQTFFNANHGQEWQCSTCHGKAPTGMGRHAVTGKTISPLAPAANPKSFTDSAKVEKWFKRNCKDVLARECSATEKADVLAWLISLR